MSSLKTIEKRFHMLRKCIYPVGTLCDSLIKDLIDLVNDISLLCCRSSSLAILSEINVLKISKNTFSSMLYC